MTEQPRTPTDGLDHRALASFPDYASAQRLVDRLSDRGFPVANVRIIGTGIRSVEQVTGRRTTGKVALQGAASGAWFGLLLGLLFSLFAAGTWFWLSMILLSVLAGAVFGAIFGALGHAVTGGKRDFASVQKLQAAEYHVEVTSDMVAEARRIAG